MSTNNPTAPPRIEEPPPRSRHQFKLWVLLLLPVICAGVLLWLDAKLLLPTHAWLGRKTLIVDFEITLGATGRPLEGVLIEFFSPSGKLRASAVTGPDGRATIIEDVSVTGRANVFRKVGAIATEPFDYQISFEGRSWGKSGYVDYSYPGVPERRHLIRWGL